MNKTYILFSSFKRDIFDLVFPDGMAEHRVPLFRNFVVNGLIQLQTYCESYQLVNVGFYDKDQSFDDCGLSVIQACRGQIGAVYAFKPSCRCTRYFYDSASLEKLSCLYENCRCAANGCTPRSIFSLSDYSRDPAYCGDYVSGNDGCRPPYLTAEPEDDLVFIASEKYFAIGPGNKLWLFPRFPCGWLVGVHWKGIRRSYLDTDYVLDDDDLKDAIAAYVESEVARRVDKDQATADKVYADYRLKAGDIIFREERDLRPRATRICMEGLDLSELVQIYPDNPYPVYMGDQCAEKKIDVVIEEPPAPDPEPFLSAAQSVSCGGLGDLNSLVGLPSNLSISGPTLTVAAGEFSAPTQEAADALALAYVTDYFNAGISSGSLVCGVFMSAQQVVTCPVVGNLLSAAGALPAHLTISGADLILEAGYTSSNVNQATADANALAYLQGYFDDNIASDFLVCETPLPEPPGIICVGWWKADSFSLPDLTPVGGTGVEWVNQFLPGQRDMTQSTPGFRPLFRTNAFGTRPGIQFDGIDDFFFFSPVIHFESILGTDARAFTAFFVFKQAAADNKGVLLCNSNAPAHQIFSRGSSNDMFAYDGVGGIFNSSALSIPQTDPKVIVWRNSVDVVVYPSMFRENKVNKGPFDQSALGFDFNRFGDAIGYGPGSGHLFFSGIVAEIILYCTLFTDSECDEVYDNYLKVKYDVLPP